MASKSGEVLAFEIDEKLKPFLEVIEKKHKNLNIVYGDALKFSWEGYNKIVSNSPYSLAEPIIKKAVEANVEELILIVGEKFKDVVLENKSKAGVVTNLFFDFKPIIKIKKKVLALCQELIPAWSDCREKENYQKKKEFSRALF